MAKPPDRPGPGRTKGKTEGRAGGKATGSKATGKTGGGSRGRRSPYPTPEEEALFRGAMADAAPLPRRRRGKSPAGDAEPVPAPPPKPPPTPAPVEKPRGRSPAKPPAAQPRPAPMRVTLAAAPQGARLEPGVAADLDRRTMDRLRRGKLAPEARLDLHGMTAAAAHRALGSFLGAAHATGKRCILVITGKGSLKEGGGVLRRELPHWLNAADNRPRVLGFAQARPEDGGGGAFYVLLKRRRAPPTK